MWLLIPSSESDSAPALSALNSVLKSQSPTIEQSAWWNGKSRSLAELRRAFKKDRSLRYLLGMTLPPLTGDVCADLFLLSLRGFLASRSQLPANEREPATNVGSGRISRGSSAKSRRKSSSSRTSPDYSSTPLATLTDGKWKSSQMTLLGEWEPFSGTWPGSGSMRNGVVYERPTLAPVTAGKESSFWPTAPGNWPTPDANAMNDGESPETFHARREKLKRIGNNGNGAGTPLTVASVQWQTPQARDHRSGETVAEYGNARPLNEQVSRWNTPKATQGMGKHSRTNGKDYLKLDGQAEAFQSSPTDPLTQDGKTCWCKVLGCVLPGHKRKLNPLFVTWLQGWPIWWLIILLARRAGIKL